MNELGMMAEQLRRVRQAEQEFLLRAAIDKLIVGPMFLDGLLRAVENASAPAPLPGDDRGLHSWKPADDEG